MKYVVDKLHVLLIWLMQEMTNFTQLKITMLEECGFIFCDTIPKHGFHH